MYTKPPFYLILGLFLMPLSLAAQPANLIFGTAETHEQFIQIISTATNDILLLGSAEGQVQVTHLDSDLTLVNQWSLPLANLEANEFARRFFLQDGHLFILGEGRMSPFWDNYAYLNQIFGHWSIFVGTQPSSRRKRLIPGGKYHYHGQ